MDLLTTDLCDRHESLLAHGDLRVLAPGFLPFGRRRRFFGEAVTIKQFEDNTLVRATLEEAGRGRVLVVDGGGSLRCALLGGNLAALAAKNGWSGVVVHGCVRDSEELNACDLGVRALGLHPRRSEKRGGGQRDVPVQCGGALIRPGEWIYADEDGVLVSTTNLAPARP